MEIIIELIDEYYVMGKGEFIQKFEEEILFSKKGLTFILKRKVLKHIVESRMDDNYSTQDIIKMFEDFNNVISRKEYKIIPNKKEDAKSFILLQTVFTESVGIVVALEMVLVEKNTYIIKTIFYRAITKVKKLLEKQ